MDLQKKKEKALIIGVILPGINRETVYENLDELEMLANTAGANIIGRDTQRLVKINPSFFYWKW